MAASLRSVCFLLSLVVLSVLAWSAVAQSTTYSFCFTSSSLPNSPYGPWSVATQGTLTLSAPFWFNVSGTPANAGGARYAQTVTAVTGSRTQLNRDGTTSSATLGLCATGVQGSDNQFYNNTPYTDWNGICLSVVSSTDKPYAGNSGNWIVYPNGFPTQQVELYYDLPTYNYPTEYHHDNQTNGVLTVSPTSTPPTCTPAPITASQPSALTYQFCYQAYAAASSSAPAWQVAIQGTFLTKMGSSVSAISGQCGWYILSVTGTRTQTSNGVTQTTPIVGQTWHNSGGGDANEYGDDPLLVQYSPYLDAKGFVLYMNQQFTWPNGSISNLDNYYAKVASDPLAAGRTVVESTNPTSTDWSNFVVSCSCTPITCPTISSSSSAAVTGTAPSTTCNAISGSTVANGAAGCTTANSNTASNACTPTATNPNSGSHNAVSALTLLLVVLTSSAVAML